MRGQLQRRDRALIGGTFAIDYKVRIMNYYEERQERRRERYLDLASKNEAKSVSALKASHNATAGIPFGQPILMGHHSEKRHRAALNCSDNAMRHSIAADKRAAYYAIKAAGVGKGGISSDDPEAVTKLQARIDKAEAKQAMMKAVNKIIKSKKLTDTERFKRLYDEHEIGEFMVRELMEPDFCGRVGYPGYELTNNNANIRRMRQRIEQLHQAPTETTERECNGVRVVNNTEENRVQLIFPGKPPAEVRAILKGHGFRWSRYNTAWQRHLNNAGIYAAEQVLASIAKQE